MQKPLIPIICVALAGCASAPAEPAKDIEGQFVADAASKQDLLSRQKAFEGALLNVDKALDKYVQSKVTSEFDRSERTADSLHDYIRLQVVKHFDEFVRTADTTDARSTGNRAIAVAALGFSLRPEALTPLVNAVQDSNDMVVRNATLGLGVLREPRTPPEVLGKVLEDDKRPLLTRIGASAALMELQPQLFLPTAVAPIWLRVLGRPVGEVDPAILMHALRGVGLLRDKQFAKAVLPFVSHPVPKVRCAAAIALGRLGDPAAHEALLALIGPAEQNPNVRLFARKALMALAGGVDREYDVPAWRKVFQLGN